MAVPSVDNIFNTLVTATLGGGSQGVIAILILAVVLLIMDRRRLNTEIDRKDSKLDKIIDDYHSGNLTLAEALTSLKSVLVEIKAKF